MVRATWRHQVGVSGGVSLVCVRMSLYVSVGCQAYVAHEDVLRVVESVSVNITQCVWVSV